ncbi:uncharacterized protein HD556DRAFT_1312848 [Suillus plorans]|uniref:Uncharacterized protein n=1 Tax=Suillus plorans TaxID=116603 RepID=A0A9P7AFH3_9AGAM|nr:uncharacterized protein HD556DRAFT_1312848 [Suillus plorans]KAG1787247.1 hypothetical protein HD556DRAFT_1312848 [Suillus plorans]
MAYFITTCRRGNWQHFNGLPTDTGGKYTLHYSRHTARHTYFATRVAFARQVEDMWKYRYFGALKGCAGGKSTYPRYTILGEINMKRLLAIAQNDVVYLSIFLMSNTMCNVTDIGAVMIN